MAKQARDYLVQLMPYFEEYARKIGFFGFSEDANCEYKDSTDHNLSLARKYAKEGNLPGVEYALRVASFNSEKIELDISKESRDIREVSARVYRQTELARELDVAKDLITKKADKEGIKAYLRNADNYAKRYGVDVSTDISDVMGLI